MSVTEGTIQPEPAEGQVPAGDFTPVPQTPAEAPDISKDLVKVAQEVVAGKWGRGNRRKTRLREAGFNPDAVQHEVDRIFNQK